MMRRTSAHVPTCATIQLRLETYPMMLLTGTILLFHVIASVTYFSPFSVRSENVVKENIVKKVFQKMLLKMCWSPMLKGFQGGIRAVPPLANVRD
uniref:Transmembrane protein n=1 Tax=Romanomermis culicivorax TaxID=13658 RepID=A0A915J6T3_ROMCU